jgi:hypothetical protein
MHFLRALFRDPLSGIDCLALGLRLVMELGDELHSKT